MISTLSLHYIIWAFLFINPNDFSTIKSERGLYSLSLQEQLVLRENIQFQPQNLSTFTFSDDLIVMSSFSPATVMAYNRSTGKQIMKLGRAGNGPFEYQQIVDVKIFDNQIAVLCAEQGLLLYDDNGNGLKQHTSKSPFSQQFDLMDGLLALKLSFHPEIKLNEGRDLNTAEQIFMLGTATDNDLWLRSMWHSGDVFFYEGNLVYSLSDELAVHVYDIDKKALTTYFFNNQRYRRYHLDATREQVQQDPMLMIDYVMDRSIIANLYPFDDGFIIEIDHRKLNEPFYSELMILDKDFEWIDSIILEPSFTKTFGENSKAALSGVLLYYHTDSATDSDDSPHKLSFFSIL